MIRLFRQKRKNLMAEADKQEKTLDQSSAKVARYLRYAIGEIVLVVLGILIALSINNWNERRKENALKNTYSIRLINDLKNDVKAQQLKITRIEDMQSLILEFIHSLDSEFSIDEQIVLTEKYFSEGWSTVNFSAQGNTYIDLSQTGNMKVFKDTDVREQILSYYSLVDNYKSGYEINKDWVLPMDVAISEETNALGFSAQTRDVYQLKNKQDAINELRMHEKLLKRHASVHFWINNNMLAT